MYRIEIIEPAIVMSRIVLKNLETATVEICYDDSALSSFDNFSFMTVNHEYHCKIFLCGEVSEQGETYKIIDHVYIGIHTFCVVSSWRGDIYYILDQVPLKRSFVSFQVKRKMLLQVNDRLHPSLI